MEFKNQNKQINITKIDSETEIKEMVTERRRWGKSEKVKGNIINNIEP